MIRTKCQYTRDETVQADGTDQIGLIRPFTEEVNGLPELANESILASRAASAAETVGGCGRRLDCLSALLLRLVERLRFWYDSRLRCGELLFRSRL